MLGYRLTDPISLNSVTIICDIYMRHYLSIILYQNAHLWTRKVVTDHSKNILKIM